MSSTRCLLRPTRALYRTFRPTSATIATSAAVSRRALSSASSPPGSGDTPELDVGELQGAKFKVEPLRRTGEDTATTRARLLCQSSYHPFCFFLCPAPANLC